MYAVVRLVFVGSAGGGSRDDVDRRGCGDEAVPVGKHEVRGATSEETGREDLETIGGEVRVEIESLRRRPHHVR